MAVLRLSRGRFEPSKYDVVRDMINETGTYLVPAISALPGLLHYYAATSPDGATVQVSIWESEEHATQMATLSEMRERALPAALALGIEFEPILQHEINWEIPAKV